MSLTILGLVLIIAAAGSLLYVALTHGWKAAAAWVVGVAGALGALIAAVAGGFH